MAYPKSDTVRDYIQRHFGTVARFADLTGQPPAQLRNTLKRVRCQALADLLTHARLAVTKKLHTQPASFELRPGDVDKLRDYIQAQYGGNVSAFARAAGVDYPTLDRLLDGHRKRKTKLVSAILAAANVPGYAPASS